MVNPIVSSGSYQETCSGCSVPILDFERLSTPWTPFSLNLYLTFPRVCSFNFSGKIRGVRICGTFRTKLINLQKMTKGQAISFDDKRGYIHL